MKRSMFGVIAFVVFSVGVSPAQVNGQSVVPEKVHKALENSIGIWDVEVTQGSVGEKGMKGKWINESPRRKQRGILKGYDQMIAASGGELTPKRLDRVMLTLVGAGSRLGECGRLWMVSEVRR